MLQLGSVDANTLQKIMQTRGGFAWWYLDLVDEKGDGLVFIWFAGLPFLPDVNLSQMPIDRPGVSLATYEKGRCNFYLVQEHAHFVLQQDGRGVDLGDTKVRWQRDRWGMSLNVKLDLVVPATQQHLTGSIRAAGRRCRTLAHSAGAPSDHRWMPLLACASGEAALSHDDKTTLVRGRVYLDSNASARPLSQLEIGDWRWGRIALPDREVIFYFVESREGAQVELVLEVFADGSTRLHERPQARWFHQQRSFYGPRWHRRLELTSSTGLNMAVYFRSVVDNGPFYLRFLVDGLDRNSGSRGRGFAERVDADRIDIPWQRPFVRMRCHHIAAANSMWLPLFSGPRSGRVSRLIRQTLTRRPSPAMVGAS